MARPREAPVTRRVDSALETSYRELVNSAFETIFGGNAKEGFGRLKAIERTYSPNKISVQTQDASHLYYWTQLQRAAAYEELSMLSESQKVLERFIRRFPDRPGPTPANDCFCLELTGAKLALARVHAAKGDFVSAIRLTNALGRDLDEAPFHGDSQTCDEINSLREYCFEFLGYDEVIPVLARDTTAEPIGLEMVHWQVPVPICGDVHEGHSENYATSWMTYHDIDEESRIQKYEALSILRDAVRQWSEACPNSTKPRRLLATYSLWMARYEVEFNFLDELEASMNDAQEHVVILAEASSEGVADLLIVTRTLLALAIDVAYHDFANDDIRSKYFPLSYGCIITSQALLEAVLEESPVNQAVAIVMSLCSNTASSIYEMIERYPEAIAEMSTCLAVVRELLKRDPLNDRGMRLLTLYESAFISSDSSAEQYVQNLIWHIERP